MQRALIFLVISSIVTKKKIFNVQNLVKSIILGNLDAQCDKGNNFQYLEAIFCICVGCWDLGNISILKDFWSYSKHKILT